MLIGLVSGAMGPFSNAPIDTIKTCVSLPQLQKEIADESRRIQKASKIEGESSLKCFTRVTGELFKNEGVSAFYKGITPRVLRVAPGQAIVFTVSIPLLEWSWTSLTLRCTSV